jgi:pimeloyl-ACP methyl ester carboxylesterase
MRSFPKKGGTPLKPSIHYVTKGDRSNPCLLLVHGLGWTTKTWNTVTEALSKDFFLVIVDLPGHGQSPKLQHYTFENVADELHTVVMDAGMTNFSLAGSSIGASISLVYANKYRNISNLFLLDGGYRPFQETEGLTWEDIENTTLPDGVLESKEAFIEFMRGDNHELWNESIEAAVLDQVYWDREKEKLQFKLGEQDQLSYMRAEWEFIPADNLDNLPDTTALTIVIALNEHTDKDLSLRHASEIVEKHTNTDIAVLEDTDHLVMLDKPEKLANLLKQKLLQKTAVHPEKD